jgi:hypothetical protein
VVVVGGGQRDLGHGLRVRQALGPYHHRREFVVGPRRCDEARRRRATRSSPLIAATIHEHDKNSLSTTPAMVRNLGGRRRGWRAGGYVAFVRDPFGPGRDLDGRAGRLHEPPQVSGFGRASLARGEPGGARFPRRAEGKDTRELVCGNKCLPARPRLPEPSGRRGRGHGSAKMWHG